MPKHYPEVPSKPDLPAIERQILAFWDADDIFKKSIENREGCSEYVFYDGPAFGNGTPHYGHILTSYVKDLVPRYQTMIGKKVPRNIGWDCHGLPAELDAEKHLKISGRQEVQEFGIKEFNEVCRERVMMYVGEWEKMLNCMGRWIEYDKTYRTMDFSYTESVLWAFKQLYDKGLIFEGKYSIWYSYGAESTVSNSETRQDDSYREREDTAVTVAFELENPIMGKPTFVLAWTTTPWTLLSNFALAIGPDIDYAVMELDGKHYIIGDAVRERYKQFFENAKLVKVTKGRDLVEQRYKPMFDFFADASGAFKIFGADFVTTEDGTGIVHLAPFGEDDLVILEREGIAWTAPVDLKGRFTNQVGKYAGLLVFDAVAPIVADLKEMGILVKKEQYKHMYPHCWRTGVPLINMPLNSWYVDVPKIRARTCELNQKINWIPSNVRDGQMGKWLENARPWAISRNRFFGAPIPVWKSDNPDYPRIDVYGSKEELERDFGVPVENFHRPFIDDLVRPNPNDPTGKSMMRRIPDVLDCWFESGAMPFASMHYPFENKEWFDSHFPSDFIVEYVAQTRGWFYNMIVLATALFDEIPFKTAICHGVVVDAEGKKLSKSKRNYPDPMETIETLGSDSLRWFLMGSSILSGGNLSIDKEGKEIAKASRQAIVPLWNAYYFFTLYANAGNIVAKKHPNWFGAENIMDRYILTELNELFGVVITAMDNYQVDVATREIAKFLEILNNWYIRRNRQRFWDEDQAAFDTLWTVLVYLTRVMAPMAPFITDYIFKNLTGKESVHLENYVLYTTNMESIGLLEDMRRVQQIVAVGKALREQFGLRNRQPLRKLMLAQNVECGAWSVELLDIIRDELNVKEVEFSNDISAVADSFVYLITPKIGARLGSALKEIIADVKAGNYKIEDGNLITNHESRITNLKCA
jgi:isoleucyl-tRNA synthetase